MDFIRAAWSYVGIIVVGIIIWMGVLYLPAYKRVMPDTNYNDIGAIPDDETIGVDATVTLPQLRQGDLICFHIRTKVEEGFGYIMGLPGERVGLESGAITIAGEHITDVNGGHRMADRAPTVVPANHVWVLSDHHRFDSFRLGPIPADLIIGRVGDL